MFKKILYVLFAITLTALMVLLVACGCNHEWEDATCTEPMTCTLCGKTSGELLPHEWQEATCIEPQTCIVCGATRGTASDAHIWQDATCTKPRICTVCGLTDGEALGHNWSEATCTKPRTCSVCRATVGSPNGHKLDKNGKCYECKEEVGIALTVENITKYLDFTLEYGNPYIKKRPNLGNHPDYPYNGYMPGNIHVGPISSQEVEFHKVVVGIKISSETEGWEYISFRDLSVSIGIPLDGNASGSYLVSSRNIFQSESAAQKNLLMPKLELEISYVEGYVMTK